MKESRLYSFLENDLGFNLHVLDGSKLLKDLTQIHNIGPNALKYYKETVLSALHMITFLKPGESLGVYIDSEEPYFRFKVEMNHSGSMRTLLLPEEFESFPQTLSGVARISKIYNQKQPYTSIVQMSSDPTSDILNNILKDSYQTNSKIYLDDNSEHAIMITKLPRKEIKKVVEDDLEISTIEEFKKNNSQLISDIFNTKKIELQELVERVEKENFLYLHSKEVKFDCPCSLDRMTQNLMTLNQKDKEDVFDGKDSIEVRCDYCNTIYDVKKALLN